MDGSNSIAPYRCREASCRPDGDKQGKLCPVSPVTRSGGESGSRTVTITSTPARHFSQNTPFPEPWTGLRKKRHRQQDNPLSNQAFQQGVAHTIPVMLKLRNTRIGAGKYNTIFQVDPRQFGRTILTHVHCKSLLPAPWVWPAPLQALLSRLRRSRGGIRRHWIVPKECVLLTDNVAAPASTALRSACNADRYPAGCFAGGYKAVNQDNRGQFRATVAGVA